MCDKHRPWKREISVEPPVRLRHNMHDERAIATAASSRRGLQPRSSLAVLGMTACGSSAGRGMIVPDGGAGTAATGGASASGGTGGASSGSGGAGGAGDGAGGAQTCTQRAARVAAQSRRTHRTGSRSAASTSTPTPGTRRTIRCPQTMYVCDYNNWYVVAKMDNSQRRRRGEDLSERAQGLQRRARDQLVQRDLAAASPTPGRTSESTSSRTTSG